MTKLLLMAGLFALFVSCNKNPIGDCQVQSSTAGVDGEVVTSPSADGCTPGGSGDVDDSTGGVEPEPEPEPGGPIPVPNPEPGEGVPNEAFLFDANIKFVNFERSDEEKVHKAIEIIKKVISGQEFKSKVLNFTYNGKKTFVDNNGLTNEQIYQKLIDGREDLLPTVDHQMDLELELYYSWRSTVGYTYPDGIRIYMNTKFFDYYTPTEVAGNVFHEWTHKLGFDHDSSYSLSRDSSVPYGIGYLIEELGKKYE